MHAHRLPPDHGMPEQSEIELRRLSELSGCCQILVGYGQVVAVELRACDRWLDVVEQERASGSQPKSANAHKPREAY
jgi:hypothetical protein